MRCGIAQIDVQRKEGIAGLCSIKFSFLRRVDRERNARFLGPITI